MNISLHNCYEIITDGKRQVFYNTVLGGLNQRFLNGQNFTAFIAFGTGRHTVLEGVNTLHTFAGSKQSRIYGKNFDINKGLIYLKKSIELNADEYNGLVLSEAGLSIQGDGTNIINYVAIDDGSGSGIVKQAGKSLTIIATLYLNFTENITGCLYGGENPLFELLFGLDKAVDCEIKAVFSDGNDGIRGIVRQDIKILQSFTSDLDFLNDSLTISAILPPESDFCEMILLINGLPCISYYAKNFSNTNLLQSVLLQFNYGVAVADCVGLSEVISVNFQGANIYFTEKNIRGGVSDAIKNPFEAVVKDSDRVFSNHKGDYFAVYCGDNLSVYHQEGDCLKKLRFVNMAFAITDINNILIDSSGNLYINIKTYPFMSIYKNENGLLNAVTPNRQFSENIIYTGLCEYGQNTFLYYLIETGSLKRYECYSTQITDYSYCETFVKMQEGDLRHFYSKDSDSEILCNLADKSITTYPQNFTVSENVKQLLFDCTNAYINGEFIFIQKNTKWRIFEIQTGTEKQIYESGVRKVFLNSDGSIVKLYANNKMSGMYADGQSKSLIGFAIDKRINGTITEVKVLSNGIIVTAKTKNADCYYLPFKKSNILLFCQALKTVDSCETLINIRRKSFLNFAGKKLSCSLKIL